MIKTAFWKGFEKKAFLGTALKTVGSAIMNNKMTTAVVAANTLGLMSDAKAGSTVGVKNRNMGSTIASNMASQY